MAGGDSLVAHPRGCRPRSGRCRRKPGRRPASLLDLTCDRAPSIPSLGGIASPLGFDRPESKKQSTRNRSPTRHTGAVATRPLSGSIPDVPGSYQFIDTDGRVLKVGGDPGAQ